MMNEDMMDSESEKETEAKGAITLDELKSIIDAHAEDALGVENGELTQERAYALDRYHGRPYGNEVEGRSQVVSKDLSEAVDWAMPAIMRIFTQGGTVAEFDPVGPEDEQQAEIETDYVNQVIMKDNQGWVVLHDAIKDTLLLKNGYVKHWWEETEKIEEPEYEGLSLAQVQQLMADLQAQGCEVEITGQEEKIVQTDIGPIPTFDIELKIKRKQGKVKIEAVPCEEIRVSRSCRGSLQESPYVEHRTVKTRSALIEMGMDREFVDNLPAYTQQGLMAQSFARDSVTDESLRNGNASADRSMDEIEYREVYVRVDWDGDGIAELRKVIIAGNEIPEGDDWNEPIPEVAITGFVAKRVPHRHVGESVFDDLGDLQEIKTTLLRQLLDNVYLINNSEKVVNERANINDLLESTPGGIKRVDGLDPVAGAIMPLVTPNIAGDILPVVDYIDQIKESRTGITKASSGLDPETLSNVTKGAFLENMSRASQKVEMLTRMIAETGVRELVFRVHSLLCRYQDKQRLVRMKGKYVNVNPQEWRERTDLTVKVGLGTGNEEDRQRKLMLVAQLQRDMLAPMGLVDPKQAFNLFSDVSKTLGFDIPDKYSLSPDSPEYQQKQANPPPNPAIQLEQMKSQAESEKIKFQASQDAQRAQFEAQQKQQEIAMQDAQHQREMARDMEIEKNKQEMQARENQLRVQIEAERDLQKVQFEAQLKERELQHKLQIEKMKMDAAQRASELDASVKILIAQIGAQQADAAIASAQGAADATVTSELTESPLNALANMHGDLMQSVAGLVAQLGRPKTIIRDENGRAQGIQ